MAAQFHKYKTLNCKCVSFRVHEIYFRISITLVTCSEWLPLWTGRIDRKFIRSPVSTTPEHWEASQNKEEGKPTHWTHETASIFELIVDRVHNKKSQETGHMMWDTIFYTQISVERGQGKSKERRKQTNSQSFWERNYSLEITILEKAIALIGQGLSPEVHFQGNAAPQMRWDGV